MNVAVVMTFQATGTHSTCMETFPFRFVSTQFSLFYHHFVAVWLPLCYPFAMHYAFPASSHLAANTTCVAAIVLSEGPA